MQQVAGHDAHWTPWVLRLSPEPVRQREQPRRSLNLPADEARLVAALPGSLTDSISSFGGEDSKVHIRVDPHHTPVVPSVEGGGEEVVEGAHDGLVEARSTEVLDQVRVQMLQVVVPMRAQVMVRDLGQAEAGYIEVQASLDDGKTEPHWNFQVLCEEGEEVDEFPRYTFPDMSTRKEFPGPVEMVIPVPMIE